MAEGRFFWFRHWLHQHFPHFFPDLIVTNFDQLTLEIIQETGITAIIVDFSGTLVPSLNHRLGMELLKKLIRINNQIPLILVSDLPSPWKGTMVEEAAALVGCSCVTSWFFPKITGIPLKKALAKLPSTELEKVAIVGDGRFRDIWPGNRLGFFTILITEPLAGCGLAKRWRKAIGRILKSLFFGLYQKTDP